MVSRREVLATAAFLVAFRNDTLKLVDKIAAREGAPDDEDFWMQIRQAFTIDPNFVNFNNGGCSPSPRIVQDALRRQIEYANQAPSYYMWQHLEPEIENVRRRLAKLFGVDTEEIAITRNASEALEICLLGFDLKPGDEVLTTNLDYPRMITTIQQRERRDGIKMVQIALPPVPPANTSTTDWLAKPFEQAITSKTKLILASHVSFMNGQIFPIKAICAIAKKHGIPVIVDGAHAFVQFPFQRNDLDCEYYGVSLHKWLMAPIGTGMLYVKKERIKGLWPMMAAVDTQVDDIRKFEEIGTHPAANHNAIGEALTFHEMLGGERKAARLRYLRARWTDRIKDHASVRFSTSLLPEHSCALTTVGIRGVPTGDLHTWIHQKHGIYTTSMGTPGVDPNGPLLIDGIRVSPNVYSTISEIDRFGDAMVRAVSKGID